MPSMVTTISSGEVITIYFIQHRRLYVTCRHH
ncbi:hypothetical protein HOV93_21920 [Planctomycetes bacterium FF15]|uniref:Uncharacterized protein n=1 Tax=Bremerella alba TaxID=980252 RepID=A0A7V8V559_9BACT|nr:hypothetical protein [Bremerella alba]